MTRGSRVHAPVPGRGPGRIVRKSVEVTNHPHRGSTTKTPRRRSLVARKIARRGNAQAHSTALAQIVALETDQRKPLSELAANPNDSTVLTRLAAIDKPTYSFESHRISRTHALPPPTLTEFQGPTGLALPTLFAELEPRVAVTRATPNSRNGNDGAPYNLRHVVSVEGRTWVADPGCWLRGYPCPVPVTHPTPAVAPICRYK